MYRGQQDDQNGIAIRLFMWKTTVNLIKQKPLLGYGLKGGRITLLDNYRKKGFDLGANANYHSHNQYLESALMAGIPATLILVAFVFFALRHAIRQKNFLLILMVCHFMIQSLFEATFEVQHELVFYIFFIFLFYYHAPEFKTITDK
jgi:O-antigen ligase